MNRGGALSRRSGPGDFDGVRIEIEHRIAVVPVSVFIFVWRLKAAVPGGYGSPDVVPSVRFGRILRENEADFELNAFLSHIRRPSVGGSREGSFQIVPKLE